LTEARRAGATELQVETKFGFRVGQEIVIGAGSPNEETNTATAFDHPQGQGAIILKTPLRFAHPIGTSVSVKLKAGGKGHPGLFAKPIGKEGTGTTTLAPWTTPPLTTSLALNVSNISSTTPWYEFIRKFKINDNSQGPMLPLACLCFVCLCGLSALIIAAVLDPCQRGPRRKVHRGVSVAEVGGSVASVGSVGSSYAEDSGYYDGEYSEGYGNSVVSLPEYGNSVGSYPDSAYDSYGNSVGSVYTQGSSVGESFEYGYLPQDSFSSPYGHLSTVQEGSERGSSFAGSRHGSSFHGRRPAGY
jgi:hypothetical protein